MNVLGVDTSHAKRLLLSLKTPKYVDSRSISVENLEIQIISQVDQLLKDNQLSLNDVDAFVLGSGPGSFMGLRIGFSVVRSWAWLSDKPLAVVSSLEILALSFTDFDSKTLIIPCMDAKMKKVFSAAFYCGKRIAPDVDVVPRIWSSEVRYLALEKEIENIIVVGNGFELLHEFLPEAVFFQQDIPSNGLQAMMNQDLVFFKASENRLEHAIPQYLRLSAAEEALEHDTL